MAEEDQPETYIRAFAGMQSNVNPHNLGDSGKLVTQLNVLVRRPGELVARGGLREQQGDVE